MAVKVWTLGLKGCVLWPLLEVSLHIHSSDEEEASFSTGGISLPPLSWVTEALVSLWAATARQGKRDIEMLISPLLSHFCDAWSLILTE